MYDSNNVDGALMRDRINDIVSFLNETVSFDTTKEGKVEVDVELIRTALQFLSLLQTYLSNNLDVLSENEQENLGKSIDFYNFFWASTIGIGSLRYQQADAYKLLKQLDNFSVNQAKRQGIDLDKLKSDCYGAYINEKSKREILAQKLSDIDMDYFTPNQKEDCKC